ncbi:glutamate racemase [Bernardetia sp. ABR2-2B]|uniref:glutamate racemase n=1 Tax=Bernardetia sp. ABR2-2B TaxID=3127472 RepID=UPI0030D28EBF
MSKNDEPTPSNSLKMYLQENKNTNPIGIFDSGIGGLTVAYAVKELLPHEQIIYFGDTAHLPYGEKSMAALQAYSIKAVDFLLKHHCKIILFACNSASSAAFELIKEYTATKAKVIDVIQPVVNYVATNFEGKNIGLIGTRQTINSNTYLQKIDKTDKNINLSSVATPLLASMIEEGFFNNTISKSVIAEYLSDESLQNIEGLILGCTHYPLIKKDIDLFFKENFSQKVEIIDGSFIVAEEVRIFLEQNNLLNPYSTKEDIFYVSDLTKSFEETTKIFFRKTVELELYKLWE